MGRYGDVLRQRVSEAKLRSDQSSDIAVVGMACRFPSAPDLKSFWELLRDGKDVITEIPLERWDWRAYSDGNQDESGMYCSRWGGFIDQIDQFDPCFFEISPREARVMDPQQRLFLEIAWRTLEHAGYAGEKLLGADTGVFVGCSNTHYFELIQPHLGPSDYGAGLGNKKAILPNRVSYFLNLNGPSVSVDTLCSSSLVAVHMACESIRRGECTSALAGGVNILLSPTYFMFLGLLQAHSPDGRCKVFDHRANGFVSGEGVGAVLLKPLRRALDDGDTIYAVIRGSAINHDGRTNGLFAPSPKSQARLIAKVYETAGIPADSISYVEAHATGTSLGDPIEIAGLTQAFRKFTERTQFCPIGSVKTNVGHLEAAAGIASLIKVILSLNHRQLPPSLHFERPNPIIDFPRTPVKVNTELAAWDASEPRRAGISSMGMSGTNVHLVVEEAPRLPRISSHDRPAYLLPISAKSELALDASLKNYCEYLRENRRVSLRDLCYTASLGRAHFKHRLAIIVRYKDQLNDKLEVLSLRGRKERLEGSNIYHGVVKQDVEEGTLATSDIDPFAASSEDWVENLRKVAQRYVSGEPVNWHDLYKRERPRRVPLPAYPFERERYWVEAHASRNNQDVGAIRELPQIQGKEVDNRETSGRETQRDAGPPGNGNAREISNSSQLLDLSREALLIDGRQGELVERRDSKNDLDSSHNETANEVAAAGTEIALSRDSLLASKEEERQFLLRSHLHRKIAEVLALAPSKLDLDQCLNTVGLDSIMAMEVRADILFRLGVDLATVRFFEGATIKDLATELLDKVIASASRPMDQAASDTFLPMIVPNPSEKYEPFPLTDIQLAYWLGRKGLFELGNISTHAYFEYESQNMDLDRVTLAWRKMIERHDMLRAVMLPDARQQILKKVPPYEIKVADLRRESAGGQASHLEKIRKEMSHQVLKDDEWPLFEIRASLLDEERIRLHFSIDLLIMDLLSMLVLVFETMQVYLDPKVSLPTLDVSFRDYVLTERALQDSGLYKRSQEYWWSRLSSFPAAPELPLARSPGSIEKPRFVRRRGSLDADRWQRLKARASRSGLTPSGVLCAAFAEVLANWSKSSRFTINLTTFNRLPMHPQVNAIVGDFTATNLLAVDGGQEKFEERARAVQEQLWRDLDHRFVSGVRVLQELAGVRGLQNQALMPVVFTSGLGYNGQGSSGSELNVWGGEAEGVAYGISQTPQVWLDHQVGEHEGALAFNWDAVEDLFPEGLLDDMFDSYCSFLQHLADDEASWHETKSRLTPASQIEQRARINATDEPTQDALLHTLFTSQVPRRSDQPAVISSDKSLTYEELNSISNKVARRLRELNVQPNTLVAVVMEKGWEQVVAVLGTLHAGAAYLPIDPGLPNERLCYLLEHGRVELVLTQSRVDETVRWPENIQRICVDSHDLKVVSDEPLESIQSCEDLAYVIFTSGSTGLPKGVMIDHHGAVNTILDINRRFNVGPEDRLLALSGLGFDLSVYDIFGTLAAGATIVMPEASGGRDPAHWATLLVQEKVTIWNSVPALMQMLVEYASDRQDILSSLRLAMLSGDWIPVSLAERLKDLRNDLELISLGGATEASIWSILYPIKEVDPAWKSIPYGRPMKNQRFHVLNGRLEPCPVWVPGELYIGGIGLAKGYWRDEEKTRVSFINHPRSGERLYRTGDIGRYLPEGNIEFLGREDVQVKVSGFRVELGEIEAVLQQHPRVKAAVVSAVGEERGQKRLAAYVVQEPESLSTTIDIPAYLAHNLLPGDGEHQLEELLLDPLERLEFKLSEPALQRHQGRESIELIKTESEEALRTAYAQRRSHRQFLCTTIPFAQFSQFLSCLRRIELDGLLKYRYGSAGGLYPVQIYLYVKPARVENVNAGIYYYDPREHRLVVLFKDAPIDGGVYGLGNEPILEEAAFAIFLIANLRAIRPMYGPLSRDFCMIEAGLISQLLETWGYLSQIGLCQIGSLDFERIRSLFALEESHIYLHSLLGGLIDPNRMTERQFPPALVGQSKSDSAFFDELSWFLKTKLPDYMVPSSFVKLDALPLTLNGKVDRKALPMPDPRRPELKQKYVSPRSRLEGTLAAMWTEVLHIERVGVHDNFFELGGNSVKALKLNSQVRDAFHVDLSLRKLFESFTVASMAQAISADDHVVPSVTTLIPDLDSEAVLDPEILSDSSTTSEEVVEPANILLTGATGFLGAFLLYELLRQTRANIYCLVRSANPEEGKHRIESSLELYEICDDSKSERIIAINGDIGEPYLGLGREQFDLLADRIDAIYHSAASVNSILPYSVLKTTNVGGTQEVIRLASHIKRKPLHYISTTRVFPTFGSPKDKIFQEEDKPDEYVWLLDGYSQSKWVAEKLVGIAQGRGLPVCIYRLGGLTGDSRTGVCNSDNWVASILKGFIGMEAIPDLSLKVEMTPIDYASKAVVRLSKRDQSLGKVFHLVNPQRIELNELANRVRSIGYPLRQIPFTAWREELVRIAEESQDNPLVPYLGLIPDDLPEDELSLREMFGLPGHDCQNTLSGLSDTTIACPPVDDELLFTYFSYFIRSALWGEPRLQSELAKSITPPSPMI